MTLAGDGGGVIVWLGATGYKNTGVTGGLGCYIVSKAAGVLAEAFIMVSTCSKRTAGILGWRHVAQKVDLIVGWHTPPFTHTPTRIAEAGCSQAGW